MCVLWMECLLRAIPLSSHQNAETGVSLARKACAHPKEKAVIALSVIPARPCVDASVVRGYS